MLNEIATASTGANSCTFYQMLYSQPGSAVIPLIGQTSNATMQTVLGAGYVLFASSSALANSFQFSQVNGWNFVLPVNFCNSTA